LRLRASGAPAVPLHGEPATMRSEPRPKSAVSVCHMAPAHATAPPASTAHAGLRPREPSDSVTAPLRSCASTSRSLAVSTTSTSKSCVWPDSSTWPADTTSSSSGSGVSPVAAVSVKEAAPPGAATATVYHAGAAPGGCEMGGHSDGADAEGLDQVARPEAGSADGGDTPGV
jgi:hypothetical protein